MLENQGLLGIAFFEATAFIILLVLFLLFRRDHHENYFRFWVAGWCCLTLAALGEVTLLLRPAPGLGLALILGRALALVLFLAAVVHCTTGANKRGWPMMPLAGVMFAAIYYAERGGPQQFEATHWTTAILESVVCLIAGWLMWRETAGQRGHGARLLHSVAAAADHGRLRRAPERGARARGRAHGGIGPANSPPRLHRLATPRHLTQIEPA